MTRKNILAISGSTRTNSSNKIILEWVAKHFSHLLELTIYEGIDQLPHFNPDLEIPGTVKEFRDQIALADGIIFCTPEYVFSLPGSLKNAIEWNVSTTLFSNKPVAIIVASASGEKALESLELIMTTLEAKITLQSKLLIQGVKGKVGENGAITDKKTIQDLEILVNSLIKTI